MSWCGSESRQRPSSTIQEILMSTPLTKESENSTGLNFQFLLSNNRRYDHQAIIWLSPRTTISLESRLVFVRDARIRLFYRYIHHLYIIFTVYFLFSHSFVLFTYYSLARISKIYLYFSRDIACHWQLRY